MNYSRGYVGQIEGHVAPDSVALGHRSSSSVRHIRVYKRHRFFCGLREREKVFGIFAQRTIMLTMVINHKGRCMVGYEADPQQEGFADILSAGVTLMK